MARSRYDITEELNENQLTLYRSQDGSVQLEVRLEKETIWLTQKQMAKLFQTERSVITKHLGNVFSTSELDKESVCAKFAHTAEDGKTYKTQYYNLDAVISVGYRINSRRGTEFRIWATNVLRSHIIKGYSVNPKRLSELKQTIKLAAEISARIDLKGDEAAAILQSISDYAYALDLLDDYDRQHIRPGKKTTVSAVGVEYHEAMQIISRMKEKFGGVKLFGMEKDQSLYSSLSAIIQTFEGKDLYPSLEEKAAHLLYFLVKNHSFIDGNKRIAAALFLRFMEKNNMLYHEDGTRRIADNALVAMTLMIAISRPQEKEILTSMVVNLINAEN